MRIPSTKILLSDEALTTFSSGQSERGFLDGRETPSRPIFDSLRPSKRFVRRFSQRV